MTVLTKSPDPPSIVFVDISRLWPRVSGLHLGLSEN